MSLLGKKPTCPIHDCEPVLSHHGKKSNLGHYFVEVVGAPLLYCPQYRLINVSRSADSSVNVAPSTTLIELDNFDDAVTFASNLVGNDDTAFLRRMLAHVELRLPATEQREQIWRCHIPRQLPLAEDVDLEALALDSEGAAGGDIQNTVLRAASYASMRQGAEQVVTLSDLKRAIAFLLECKRKILQGDSGSDNGRFDRG
jgi:ATP-dependent 26S proteasome regulatory subunit